MKKIRNILLITIAVVMTGIISAAVAISAYTPSVKNVYNIESVEKQTGTENVENILFLGMDREAGLTDVIMLIGVNKDTGSITLLQIPRDTYAEYTDGSYKKLNGAYKSLGGAKEVAAFLSDSWGIEIDSYMCIGLDTLGDVVDALGGVDIDLPSDMKYSDPEQGLYIDLKAGKQTLDGKTAQHFVRFRSDYANGDLGRIDAQKLFMSAFFHTLCDKFSPVTAAKLVAVAEGVETNIGASDMLELCSDALDVGGAGIAFVTLPGKEVIATESGASYYAASAPSAEELTELYFGRKKEFDSEKSFLNEKYDSFKLVYENYVEYDVCSVSDILRDGI